MASGILLDQVGVMLESYASQPSFVCKKSPKVDENELGVYSIYTFNGPTCDDSQVMAATIYHLGRCIVSGNSSFMYSCGKLHFFGPVRSSHS